MADVAALWGWPLSDLERLTLWETLDWRARAVERRSWPVPVVWVKG
ncbi:GpE family phage tail protein [Roseospira visakhapatnamensis]|uniref:GpE protein n=1 Tax=Roseospira visakhapatnamensis TaxID=390880 RepID=A0A7W6REI4_9PROT|nr:GpE family phage tail protein [Roseospira visakhapatnamensis]MBB4266880.1 hypothetical protein [Roseospira visakhapatnamensis]